MQRNRNISKGGRTDGPASSASLHGELHWWSVPSETFPHTSKYFVFLHIKPFAMWHCFTNGVQVEVIARSTFQQRSVVCKNKKQLREFNMYQFGWYACLNAIKACRYSHSICTVIFHMLKRLSTTDIPLCVFCIHSQVVTPCTLSGIVLSSIHDGGLVKFDEKISENLLAMAIRVREFQNCNVGTGGIRCNKFKVRQLTRLENAG